MDKGDFVTINQITKITNWESETADILFKEKYDTVISNVYKVKPNKSMRPL